MAENLGEPEHECESITSFKKKTRKTRRGSIIDMRAVDQYLEEVGGSHSRKDLFRGSLNNCDKVKNGIRQWRMEEKRLVPIDRQRQDIPNAVGDLSWKERFKRSFDEEYNDIPNRDSTDLNRSRTIHGCAHSGDFSGFQKLLSENPSLLNDRTLDTGNTPLHVSAGYNRVEIIKFLFDWEGPGKIELEAKNLRGETPLHVAATNGRNESAQMLLSHGALVEAKTDEGNTPLHLAVWHARRTEYCSTVWTLIEYNANCNAQNCTGNTPLHVSAGHNRVEIIKFLLNWKGPGKIELEAKNLNGETPLHVAARSGRNEAAHMLLVHGASVEANADMGVTPLHLAVWHALRTDDWSTVWTLIEYNADCSAQNYEGKTPLSYLSERPGSEKVLELINMMYLEKQRKRKAF